MKFQYVVQMADSFGFDFGGENGGIAGFVHKGEAYAYADSVRKALGRELRVIDMKRKGHVEFHLMPEVAAA